MNLPNLISLARLIAVPLAVWLILDNRPIMAFWVFIAAGISDAVDGFLARQLNARTTLGSFLDPLADKALLVSVYVTLGYVGHLPDWLVILVVFRDVLIVGGVVLVYILTGKAEMRPLMISKINTTFQILLATFVLIHIGYGLNLLGPQQIGIYAVAATTILSGAAYIRGLIRQAPVIEESE